MSQNSFELSKYFTPNFLIQSGKVLSIVGTSLLITETIAGLFAIDIAILVVISKESKKRDNSNSFLLGYLYGNLSRNHWCLAGTSLLGIAVASFIESIVASILLAFQFHMPIIAIAVVATWLGTIAMVCAGNALQQYGALLKEREERFIFSNSAATIPSAPPFRDVMEERFFSSNSAPIPSSTPAFIDLNGHDSPPPLFP
jgi:hypothetical protein